MRTNNKNAHLHLKNWSVTPGLHITLIFRLCAEAGKRAHQPFGPLLYHVIGDDFWMDPEVADTANLACDRLEKDELKKAAFEGLDLDGPLPGL